MALHHSPSIVTSGLVLCLDAANVKSYPGTGTTWTDLSGNGYNATLTGSPSYTSGYFTFDAVDDALSVNMSCNKTYYSFDFWGYPTSLANYNWAFLFNNTWGDFVMHTTSTGGVFIGTSVASRIAPWRNDVLVLNQWQNFTWTFDNGAAKFYKNGVLETSANLAVSSSNSFTTFYTSAGSSMAPVGRLSNIKIYSGKALSQSEVQQNFNALRGRYGI